MSSVEALFLLPMAMLRHMHILLRCRCSFRDSWFPAVSDYGNYSCPQFAEVSQLTEEYYAPGSLGSFNLQMAVTVHNNQYEDWAQNS